MIKIYCKTNLDLSNAETWPTELPCIPRVGDSIESGKVWNQRFVLRLNVVSVTWRVSSLTKKWYPEIELHDYRNRSIRAFYEWYGPLVGKSVSYFI